MYATQRLTDPSPLSSLPPHTHAQAQHFSYAVDQQYWYELVVDDLPMWGMVGEQAAANKAAAESAVAAAAADSTPQNDIFTHRTLTISYNGDQIIEVNLTSENPEPIKAGKAYQFTYTVKWSKTEKTFEGRFDRYLEYDFFEHKVHWFSIFNSFMMVIFLCGLVAVILLRTLRNDFARYAKEVSFFSMPYHTVGSYAMPRGRFM